MMKVKSKAPVPSMYTLLFYSIHIHEVVFGWFMVFNATFNNISVISWRSVPGENHPDFSQVTDKLYHIMLYRVHLAMNGVRTHKVGGDI